MSNVVIQVERLAKKYDLGVIGSGTLKHDLNRWWSRLRGRPDPYAPIDTVHKSGSNEQNGEAGSVEILKEELWALRDVSFEVNQGEIVGIIGRNGAGKSTLLKILSRTTAPTSGEVRVKGRIASLLEVGTGFHPDLTGRENVFLNGAILGMTHAEIRRKFDEIVAFSEVEQFIDTPVKRYSSGMYVRLAFAVAAHLEPEILIVDEILAVGDAEFQKKCLGKMQDVSGSGRTVLVVSHNMRVVQTLCNRALYLNKGQFEAFGPVAEVVQTYLKGANIETDGFASLDPLTFRNRRGTGEVRFSSVELLNSEGYRSGELRFAESCSFRIEVTSAIAAKDLTLGFSFVNLEGVEVQGTSAHDGGLVVDVERGRYVLQATIDPMILTPGRYILRGAVFKFGALYDHLDEIMEVTVTNIASDTRRSPRNHYVGLVYLPYKWSWLETPGNGTNPLQHSYSTAV